MKRHRRTVLGIALCLVLVLMSVPAAQAKTMKCRSPEFDVRHLSATNVHGGCLVAQEVAIAGDNWLNRVLFSVNTQPHYRFTLRVCPGDVARCERWHYKWSERTNRATAWHHRQSIGFTPIT
jgi:hypothetical protein